MSHMYKNSDHAINARSKSIVYKTNKGRAIKIARDGYDEWSEFENQNVKNNQNPNLHKSETAGDIETRCPNASKCLDEELNELRHKLKTKALDNIPITFDEFKKLSDLEYKRQWQKDDIEYKNTLPSGAPHDYAEHKEPHRPSAENEYFNELKHKQKKRIEIGKAAFAQLTPKQQRRYFLYHALKKTLCEISNIEEDVNVNAIYKSIKQAQKKSANF